MPPPSVGTLCMHCLHQEWIQDQTLLLEQLVTVPDDWVMDLQAWQAQGLEQERNWEDHVFQERNLAIEEKHIALLEMIHESQEHQAAMVAPAVKASEEDFWVLDTILALAISQRSDNMS
ncbi:hypothetical protein Y1Q_0021492 [Alligator mississippiensis]|uniref:Uncharacterized protein n=1 Tax=Alligator mississippiensis TaxID=8496 RepID=A0A151P9S7_ALLMI|nr:hypothetical protein Y1Q_0021492 [Alligator mississippiensis]